MNQAEPQEREQENTLGKPIVMAQIECEGYRCLAYRDDDGKWRHYYTHRELDGVKRVIFSY